MQCIEADIYTLTINSPKNITQVHVNLSVAFGECMLLKRVIKYK